MRSVLFRAPLDAYLDKGISQFEIDQPDFKAFLTTYRDGRWVLIFPDDVERDASALRAAIVKAIGRADLDFATATATASATNTATDIDTAIDTLSDLDTGIDTGIEVIATGRWELAALVADRFSSGRVFLAGDAAHVLPPTRGGFGANTGIHDAFDLSWKLAAVLSGTSTPALLDTYDAERRPTAWRRHQQTFARPDYAAHANGIAKDEPILDEMAMELGQLYRSTAVIGVDESMPPALRPEQWTGQPGTRAPHLWVTSNGRRVSTLDLFHRSWVLMTEDADARWRDAAARAGEELGIELRVIRVGEDVLMPASTPDAFRAAFGLTDAGASLIRPDGYVAWRSVDRPTDPHDPYEALRGALRQVACATRLTSPAA